MKTLNEITNGYLSIFEHMTIMSVASRLDVAACCDNEAEDAHSKEFCDCVHCILCSYVVSGSLTAVEIPCDVSILLWVNAEHYVINWFNDYNDPDDDDDFDPDDDFDSSVFCTEDVVDTETTEDMMYPDCSSHFITKDMEAEYDPTDDYTEDTDVPDYSTKQLNATQYKAELIETMAAYCTELNWFQISELIDQLSDMADYYANI